MMKNFEGFNKTEKILNIFRNFFNEMEIEIEEIKEKDGIILDSTISDCKFRLKVLREDIGYYNGCNYLELREYFDYKFGNKVYNRDFDISLIRISSLSDEFIDNLNFNKEDYEFWSNRNKFNL